MAELRRHVREELAEPDGVVVIDPSAFPKKGTESCGVARQWCGRLGKVDNCQVGVFLAYAADGRLRPAGPAALPARGLGRRRGPAREVPRPARRSSSRRSGGSRWTCWTGACPACPTAGSSGDDEFGRACGVPRRVAPAQERYVLDVPCNTMVRDLERRRPRRAEGRRRPQARGAVPAGRRLGGEPAGVAVGADHGPRRREGAAGGRCDDGAGPGQAGRPDRAGGAAGGDPAGRRVADRLRLEQRRPRGPPGRSWSAPSGSGTGSRRCSRPARARSGWITTRSGVGWAGITT